MCEYWRRLETPNLMAGICIYKRENIIWSKRVVIHHVSVFVYTILCHSFYTLEAFYPLYV